MLDGFVIAAVPIPGAESPTWRCFRGPDESANFAEDRAPSGRDARCTRPPWQLMPPDKILELLLIFRAVEHQPVCRRISDAIAEDHIQPERNFVDEVVHIAVQAAVVVACEKEPLLVIEKYPVRKMNCRYAGQSAAIEDVPRCVVDKPENIYQCPAPE